MTTIPIKVQQAIEARVAEIQRGEGYGTVTIVITGRNTYTVKGEVEERIVLRPERAAS